MLALMHIHKDTNILVLQEWMSQFTQQMHTSVDSFSLEKSEALLRRSERKYVSNTLLDLFVCTQKLTKKAIVSFTNLFFYAQFSE